MVNDVIFRETVSDAIVFPIPFRKVFNLWRSRDVRIGLASPLSPDRFPPLFFFFFFFDMCVLILTSFIINGTNELLIDCA